MTAITAGAAIDRSPLRVLGHGRGWLGVEKPAGMSIHNDPGEDLCAWVTAYCSKHTEIMRKTHADSDFGFQPVHRLDRETSGVVLMACTRQAFRMLSQQFESREVQKKYMALLHGRLESPAGDKAWGNWSWPLTKRAGGRRNPAGTGRRLSSETRFRVVDSSSHYSFVEIALTTGRKHQIRRHAALAGHAVAGDTRYGTTRAANYLRRHFNFCRLALHACAVTLRPPGAGAPVTIGTPALPRDMQLLLIHDKKTTQT